MGSKASNLGEIMQNKGHYTIQSHWFWYQSKAHIRHPIGE